MDGAVDVLESARRAVGDHAWQEAFDAFVAADAATALSPEDLDVMAEAAYWSSHTAEALDACHRAYAGYVDAGRFPEAAWTALVACRLHFVRGDASVASGWIDRARRLLEDLPECRAHAMLAWLDGQFMMLLKGHDQALERSYEVEAIANRLGDRDLVALARGMQGFLHVQTGETPKGMGLLGEAVTGAIAGELGSFATAEVVCEMIVSCLDVADYERAAEWLESAERAGPKVTCFPGCCRTHRATVLRHRGEWSEAQREAQQARAELEGVEVLHQGMALTEIGELHRCKGHLPLAEKAFGEAYEKGWPPQPGLALLLLSKGDVAGATAMIERAVDRSTDEPAALVHLLPAQVEIAVVAGDVETVAGAATSLAGIASALGTSAAQAANAGVEGVLHNVQGDPRAAAARLEQSVRHWQQARNPYETAHARMRLAGVLESLGDEASAKLELGFARATFERLGADPEAREAARRLGEEGPRRSACTFMFTDIVNSTSLLTAIGDDGWHGVRQWHDRTVGEIVTEHSGRIVKETGDGFFVAFDEPALAVASAVAIQRALSQHRRSHGFSPAVRIGLHTGSAIAIDQDYAGRDVVVAARIAALAQADEVLVSGELADQLGGAVNLRERAPRELKGIPEPVEVAALDYA